MIILSWIVQIAGVNCADNQVCTCLPGYISCRGVISLPDVLASRVYPLRQSPPVTADLRGSALSMTVMQRFLLVFGSLERVILTEQIEVDCDVIHKLKSLFPQVEIETDCVVRIIQSFCKNTCVCDVYIIFILNNVNHIEILFLIDEYGRKHGYHNSYFKCSHDN